MPDLEPVHTDVTIDTPEVVAAAKWWRDAMRNPKFDNGDNSPTGGMTMAMALMGRKTHPVEVLDKFEAALRRNIVARINERKGWCPESPGWCSYARTLSVDYNPDAVLSDSLAESGESPGLTSLPWKTVMWINPGEVKVACGYRAPPVTIYPPEVPK
jgi:hypothetical protein